MSGVRIGLVGYGVGGRYFHAPLIDGAGCVLAGVVTSNPDRRGEVEQDYPGTPVVRRIEELEGLGVDAIVISTPVATREDVLPRAAQLKVPLLCDKPFAASAAEARTLLAAAEALGVRVGSYQNRRWDSDFLTLRSVLDSGELGSIVRVESAIEQTTPAGGVTTSGGGMLSDIGTHIVDQLLDVLGPAVSVYATAHWRPDLGGLDDQFTMVLHHASGVTSHLMGSQAAHGEPVARFRVVGADASYSAPHYDGQADALFAGHTPRELGDSWGVVSAEHWGAIYRDGTSAPVPAVRGDWCALYRGVAESVRTGDPLPVPAWAAVDTLTVLDAARVSALEDRVVGLS